MSDEALNKHLDWLDDCGLHDEKMKEPWIAKTCWDGNPRFELHVGGNNYVLSLEKGEQLARNILLLLNKDDIPF